MSSIAGYNIKEEAKEIGSEISASRNELILGVLSFIAGTILARGLTEESVIDKIKSWFGYDQEEYEEE